MNRADLIRSAYAFAYREMMGRDASEEMIGAFVRASSLPSFPGRGASGIDYLAFGFFQGYRTREQEKKGGEQ